MNEKEFSIAKYEAYRRGFSAGYVVSSITWILVLTFLVVFLYAI